MTTVQTHRTEGPTAALYNEAFVAFVEQRADRAIGRRSTAFDKIIKARKIKPIPLAMDKYGLI